MLLSALGSFRRESAASVVLFGSRDRLSQPVANTDAFLRQLSQQAVRGAQRRVHFGALFQAYADPLTYQLLFNSFIFAAGSALLATFLAATLAWISIRTNAPSGNFLS